MSINEMYATKVELTQKNLKCGRSTSKIKKKKLLLAYFSLTFKIASSLVFQEVIPISCSNKISSVVVHCNFHMGLMV